MNIIDQQLIAARGMMCRFQKRLMERIRVDPNATPYELIELALYDQSDKAQYERAIDELEQLGKTAEAITNE